MSDLTELRTWLDVIAEKDAEIDRLRAALEEIEANTDDTGLTPAFMRAIARKALEEE
jgi:hypothetical protein